MTYDIVSPSMYVAASREESNMTASGSRSTVLVESLMERMRSGEYANPGCRMSPSRDIWAVFCWAQMEKAAAEIMAVWNRQLYLLFMIEEIFGLVAAS